MAERKVLIGGAIIGAVVAVGIGVLVGQQLVDDDGADGAKTVSSRTTVTTGAAQGDRVVFRDEKAGFSVSYPKEWVQLQSQDEQVVLVAAEPGATTAKGGSILARVVPIGVEFTAETLAEARKITDGIVAGGSGVEMKAEPTTITQGGLPGYFYFYTFQDPASGGRGAHSHYFLFKDEMIITLVFQAVPEGDFVRLATVFDSIADSFQVL